MAMDRGPSSASVDVQLARLDASTTRTRVRWDTLNSTVPWIAGAAAAIGVAWQLAGESTSVNVALGVGVSLVVPAGLIKIFWDKYQKIRLRDRITSLEAANRKLQAENKGLQAQRNQLAVEAAELRGRLTG